MALLSVTVPRQVSTLLSEKWRKHRASCMYHFEQLGINRWVCKYLAQKLSRIMAGIGF